MNRAASLAKLAKGLALVAEAEAELRAEEEAKDSGTHRRAKVVVTDIDRARARKALERLGRRA